MKKIICIVLTVILFVSLNGCYFNKEEKETCINCGGKLHLYSIEENYFCFECDNCHNLWAYSTDANLNNF